MTAPVIPSMLVEDIELRWQPSILGAYADPIGCDHAWEPHLWEIGRVVCARCGSLARWVNDPRAQGEDV